jgi:S-adenosylmethionine:tRNA ribosyltransferase-isomerase
LLFVSTQLFDYTLPSELIAQVPAPTRDQARLLVIDRRTRTLAHRQFSDLPEYLRSGDILFRNNAAVLPARLRAFRPTGGQVECFLLRAMDESNLWRCLVKPGRKLPVGASFRHGGNAFSGEIVAREGDGTVLVRFTTASGETMVDVAQRVGEVPLPPYIERPETSAEAAGRQRRFDRERYQTVYAESARAVAVAAPTAGLHFTPDLLSRLQANGVVTAEMTLHVGLGTFKPLGTGSVEEHVIHRELYEVPAGTQRALFPPLTGRRIAVGTTSVRSIEDFLAKNSGPMADGATWSAEAGIFLYPAAAFRGVDALITNFHQPRSTLLCLVAAFLAPGSRDGIDWIQAIYREAIVREYRFFSYGDAMLIL